MKNTVYIITHKDYLFPTLSDYKTLVVGANKNLVNSNYLKDNTGDNISDKNNSYSELTGLYWLWKNDDSDHVGLVHYRRYFVELKNNLYIKGRHVFLSKKNAYRILTIDELEDRLKGYDVLVKRSRTTKYTNKELICKNLGNEIWYNMEQAIKLDNKYVNEFNTVSSKKNHLNCNMFYSDKKIIDRYCEWLFNILNIIDENHNKKVNEYYKKRELGYLSEILFEVWLIGNSIAYKECDAVNIDSSYEVDGCMDLLDLMKVVFGNINKL